MPVPPVIHTPSRIASRPPKGCALLFEKCCSRVPSIFHITGGHQYANVNIELTNTIKCCFFLSKNMNLQANGLQKGVDYKREGFCSCTI